jgi:hypothetical protein
MAESSLHVASGCRYKATRANDERFTVCVNVKIIIVYGFEARFRSLFEAPRRAIGRRALCLVPAAVSSLIPFNALAFSG